MRILVNGLSVRNMSGRHVLMGHLERVAAWTSGIHEYLVIFHRGNRDMRRDLGRHVQWFEAPFYTEQTPPRLVWENVSLPRLIRDQRIDAAFTPSGMVTARLPVPQACLAQNPWPLIKGLARSSADRIAAAVQRRACRRAMKEAAFMVFNSRYMRELYREAAGFEETRSEIVYQAVDDATHAAAHSAERPPRKAFTVLSVSAMAPHKNATTLVVAADLLVRRYGVPVEVLLVGPWPDQGYRREVEGLVRARGIGENVRLLGHIPRQELHRQYALAKVFCLMSRCESFGIPAVEAQAFGTPVVGSDCCAVPEVCGSGGVYLKPEDAEGTASALHRLLTDEEEWGRMSAEALNNASKYRWEECSKPLLRVLRELSGTA